MIETFITINEHPKYEISNYGDVMYTDSGEVLRTAINKQGYEYVVFGKFKRMVHRLVAIAHIDNPLNKPMVDHIDGNRSNNNVNNLRWAFPHENSYNRNVVSSLNTSGYTGVNWHSYYKLWKARIKHKGLDIEIGLFATVEEAIKARCFKANELFAEFANQADKQNYKKYFLD